MNNRIVVAAVVVLGLLIGLPGNTFAKTKPAAPGLTVKLIDADQKAQKKSATVSVQVRGLRLVDPASVKEIPAKGQGHLHYRLDNGPIIATTVTKLSFHELASGPHSFTVSLAANDHSPLGPSETVAVTVP